MESKYIAALAAFLGGALISLVNALITAKQVQSEKQISASASVLRQVLSMTYLAVTYVIVRKLGIEYFMPLLGAAIGLTVPAILFAYTIANKMKEKGDD